MAIKSIMKPSCAFLVLTILLASFGILVHCTGPQVWEEQQTEESSGLLPNHCGYFEATDPLNGGIPHQPCYGPDGTVRFCW